MATYETLKKLLDQAPGSVVTTKGSASKTTTIGIDAAGRVASLSDQNIQVAESQVTNLASDLAAIDATLAALQSGKVPSTEIGQPNGVASLDGNGDVPLAELPPITDTTITISGSNSYAVQAADLGGKVLRIPALSADCTIVVDPAVVGAGFAYIEKTTLDGFKAVVTDGSAALAWLTRDGDKVTIKSDGSRSREWDHRIAKRKDYLSAVATGTVTIPPLVTGAFVEVIGAAGSGAGGARKATGNASPGGGPGNPGLIGEKYFSIDELLAAADVNRNLSYQVGDSGAGGLGATVDGADGTDGSAGTDTYLGDLIRLVAGNPGKAGVAGVAAASPASQAKYSMYPTSVGPAGSVTASASTASPQARMPGIGGAGGSIATDNSSKAAAGSTLGNQQAGTTHQATANNPPTAGTGTNGTNGPDKAVADSYGGGGTGGADGGASLPGGNGGNGGSPGGSGGGGGAARNGHNGGNGGKGGHGEIRIAWDFH